MAHLLQLHDPPRAHLVAESASMKRVLTEAGFLAGLRAPILLDGPTGTGKSTLARWIHDRSPRADGPFQHVNCGALPGALFASEVFGHVRGAFTGATQAAMGLARAAHGGTLFLDEIGEVSPEDQCKLLTFLDTECVRPVGSTEVHRVDARIVVATNRNLRTEPTFREDLRFRLEALRLTLPSLVERPEDLPGLARHLVDFVADRNGLSPLRVTHEAIDALGARDWPGNVRELRNVLLRALISAHMESCPRIEARHLNAPPARSTWKDLRQRYQGAVVAAAIEASNGNRKEAAKRLEISESCLYEVIKREGLG